MASFWDQSLVKMTTQRDNVDSKHVRGLSLYEILEAERLAEKQITDKQDENKQETERQKVETRDLEKQEAEKPEAEELQKEHEMEKRNLERQVSEKQQPETSTSSFKFKRQNSDARKKLEQLLSIDDNKFCADCSSPDPKWVSLGAGVFICIKCSGVHRSLGVHITKVLSVNLDDWTDDEVNYMEEMGGNVVANKKFECCVSPSVKKPGPASCIEERSDFIRRKYMQQEFINSDENMSCPFPGPKSSSSHHNNHPNKNMLMSMDWKHIDKQVNGLRIPGFGHGFRNSWKRKDDHRGSKKGDSAPGMTEFVGLIKVNMVKGTNLAIRDVVSSDPYIVLSIGQQSVKTSVIKNNLNPVWTETLMLSIPDCIPPLKLFVYDKDKFSTDDFMGKAEINIQPLFSAAKEHERSTANDKTPLGKWEASNDNTFVTDNVIHLVDGKIKQDISIKLQNVESGMLHLELECVPLSQ